MKYLLLLLLPVVVQSQEDTYGLPYFNGSVVYQEVIPLTGVPKEELYRRARILVNERFENATEVMFTKKQDGRITASGKQEIRFRSDLVSLLYKIDIQIKDAKYLLTIDNIVLRSDYGKQGTIHTRIEEQLLYASEKKVQSTIAILKLEDAIIRKEIEYIKHSMASNSE